MKLWELIKCCCEGAYIGGECFINDEGNILFFDGYKITLIDAEKATSNLPLSDLKLDSYWNYMEVK